MAQPTTAKFGKMRVMIGEPGFAATVAVTSLASSVAPAQITVGVADIAKFSNGGKLRIAGATGTGTIRANGEWEITSWNSPANTMKLIGLDTSGGIAQTVGVTAAPKTGATVYSAPCGLTTKSLALSKNLTEVSIPDCDDPDAPLWLGRDVQNLSVQISGDGVAAAESVPDWNDAATATVATPMKVEIEFSSGQKNFTGNFHIDNLTFGAEQGGRVTVSFNAQSDGHINDFWTPLP